MPRLIYFLLAIALILVTAGCVPASSSTPTIVPTTTSTPSPRPSPVPSPIPTETAVPTPLPPQKNHYTIEAIFDYPAHQLQVSEQIRYTNRSTGPLQEIILMVDPLYYPGSFQLESLALDDGTPIENIVTERGWLRLPLPTPLLPEDELILDIAYILNLPSPTPSAAIRPIPFGYTDRQSNLVDWYPFIPPYISGQGWLNHPASYYGEHLVYENADFEISLRLSPERPDLVLAASSPPVRDGDWYRFQHNDARNFAFSVSPYYQVLSAQAGTVDVTSYVFRGQETAGQAVLDTTVAAVELYSRLFGPYPRSSIAVVEADFLDGMEYDGMYFLSKGFYNLYQGTPGEYLVAIAAHETAHQWWYAQVGNNQALEPWLDEALSTYSERLFYENIHPEALDWWWDYRVNYYNPRGWVDTTIYNPHGDSEPYRAYRDAVYLNGAVFLEELRQLIGDQAFFDFLKTYLSDYIDQIVSINNFKNTLQMFTQADLEPLFKKYFYMFNK